MENSFYVSFSFSLLENILQLRDRAMTVNFLFVIFLVYRVR